MPEPISFNKVKKVTPAQVFSCEFCEISKNTFLHRTTIGYSGAYPEAYPGLSKMESFVIIFGYCWKLLDLGYLGKGPWTRL